MKDNALIQRDWKDAIASQSAINSGALIHSLARVTAKIQQQACEKGKGTDWVNQHPIIRLYIEQLAFLANAGMPSDHRGTWKNAYDICEAMSKEDGVF